MANKFKVGDVIRCIKHIDKAYTKDKMYEVIKLDNDGDPICVRDDGTCVWGEYSHNFELVRSAGSPVIAQHIEALAQGVRVTPEVHCACCHRAAPRIVVTDHPRLGNMLIDHHGQVNQPDLRGWLLMAYPYTDPFVLPRVSGVDIGRFGMSWQEVLKVCPKCAPQVMGTVKHMSEGWRK